MIFTQQIIAFSVDTQQLNNGNYIFSITEPCRFLFEAAAIIIYIVPLLPYLIISSPMGIAAKLATIPIFYLFSIFFLIVILPFWGFCSSCIGPFKNHCLLIELPHKKLLSALLWNTSFCSIFGTSLTKIPEDITMPIIGVMVDTTFILKFKKE